MSAPRALTGAGVTRRGQDHTDRSQRGRLILVGRPGTARVVSIHEPGAVDVVKQEPEELTYGSYLCIPQLTELQRPRAYPTVRGEMFFIIGQQVQELWFKQILYDLAETVRLAVTGAHFEAGRLLDRVNRIMSVLSAETELLQTLPPVEFKTFRPILSTASGFESEQFRELEWASGLREAHFGRLVARLARGEEIMARWPISLHDVLCSSLATLDPVPVAAIVALYSGSAQNPHVLALVEAC